MELIPSAASPTAQTNTAIVGRVGEHNTQSFDDLLQSDSSKAKELNATLLAKEAIIDTSLSLPAQTASASDISTAKLTLLESYDMRSFAIGKLSYKDELQIASNVTNQAPVIASQSTAAFTEAPAHAVNNAANAQTSATRHVNSVSTLLTQTVKSERVKTAFNTASANQSSFEPLLRELTKRKLVVFESDDAMNIFVRDYSSGEADVAKFIELAKAVLSQKNGNSKMLMVNGRSLHIGDKRTLSTVQSGLIEKPSNSFEKIDD